MPQINRENSSEATPALVGFVVCSILLVIYIWLQYLGAKADGSEEALLAEEEVEQSMDKKKLLVTLSSADRAPEAIRKATVAGYLPGRSLSFAHDHIRDVAAGGPGLALYLEQFRRANGEELRRMKQTHGGPNSGLLQTMELNQNLMGVLRSLFKKYSARVSADKMLDKNEFRDLFEEMQLGYSQEEIKEQFENADKNQDGGVNFVEFQACFINLAASPPKRPELPTHEEQDADEEEEEEEEEDDPVADLAHLPNDQKKKWILMRSFRQMGLGTLLVLLFSDPMVECFSAIGNRTGVSAFYVSFILAPLASNASELIAAYNYAKKKSVKSITISLSTLEGAAVMNNTLGLGVFYFIIYFNKLSWKFTAETLSILFVEILMFLFVYQFEVQKLQHAFIVLALYPGSLFVVWFTKICLGLD